MHSHTRPEPVCVPVRKRGYKKGGFFVPTLSKTTQYAPKTEASVREDGKTRTDATDATYLCRCSATQRHINASFNAKFIMMY